MNRITYATVLLLVVALGGCASTLSGVGGTDGYACKAPEGAQCTAISGVYANSTHRRTAAPALEKPSAAMPGGASTLVAAPTSSGHILRSNPRVLRLWVAPWEDADGDLHEEAVVHVVVDQGRWLIEHLRPTARARIDGVTPPVTPAAPPVAKDSAEALQPSRFPIPPGERPSVRVPAIGER